VADGKGEDNFIISLEDPDGVVAESYRRLRSAIVFMAATQDLQVIQVTSASQSEGKSTTVANLAVALARTGKRVVVVDADLRRPRQHALFGVAASPGITDVLVGTHEPDEVAARPIDNVALAVIPAGSTAPNPAELLSTSEMSDIIDSLAAVADIVLIDSPPLLAVSDALAVSSLVDGTVLVVQGRTTRAKELRVALDALERVDAHIVGAVLNKVKTPDRNYYQDYLTGRPAASDPVASNSQRKPMSFTFDEVPSDGNGASGNGKAVPVAGVTKPTTPAAKSGTRRSRKNAAEPAVYDADDEDSSVWASRGGR
jgi:capsular exopolysaccharide synthesis family protein